ncbi:MAG: hypothetical protein J5525_11260 [Lachnospiraceae bacterium]|nr:hypothetical protein [Lachnospiraceae bacterium]
MNKLLKNILISLFTTIGLFVIIVVILEALGVDTGLSDICNCSCSCSRSGKTPATKIKRNYTEIKLPTE